MELNLYSDKSLGVMLPEKPRQCYNGYSSGDCIGFITAMPISHMWKLPRPKGNCMTSKEFGIFSCFRPSLLNLTLDRKDKIEVLDKKRCLTIPDRDPTTGLEDEETVFSACIVPTELYGELISSYSATSVVDLSPAQGEFLKACLSARTKCFALCGTEAHSKHLELLLTDWVLAELSREGSTFFRPEAVPKEDPEKDDEEGPEKKKPKKGAEKDQKNAAKPDRKRKPEADGEAQEEKTKAEKKVKKEKKGEDGKPPKKTKKTKKEEAETADNDEDDDDGSSSAMW